MNLETNFQMLDKVNKYAEYEFIFFKFYVNIYSLLKSETA